MNPIASCFPVWGPYSKKYAGISKITSVEKYPTARFDFLTVPGVMGFDIRVPNVTLPSAYHPWLSSADYSFYSFRHDLEWKDVVYADVSYTKLSENSTLVRAEITNNTDLTKNCVVNYFSSLELPIKKPFEAVLPEKSDFIKATDYVSYNYAIRRPWDEQNADGNIKGVFTDSRFTNGVGLGDRCEKWHMPHKVLKPFGGEKGDCAKFETEIKNDYENAVLVVRYRSSDIHYVQGKQVGVTYIKSENTATFSVNGKELVLPPSDDMAYAVLDFGKVQNGKLELTVEGLGTGAAEFDFFALCEKEDADVITSAQPKEDTPEYIPDSKTEKCENGYLVSAEYKDCEDKFYLRVFDNNTRFRDVETGALEDCMSARMSNADESFDDLTESFTGAFNRKHSDDGFFLNAISHTIFVAPHSSVVRYAVISSEEITDKTEEEYESLYTEAKKKAIKIALNKDGEKYALSNQLLTAAVLTNVVYPIYKHGDYIIHHTPGKRWDCLYTWDSGFIGLGMNEYAPKFAEFILDTYLSEESNKDYAFLHHGSPVPVQIYQLFEMLQKSDDKKYLEFYDRVRLYYLFLSGKIRNSTYAKFKSGILTSYDYFYSTSGMDDYPAQVAMMKERKRDIASPVITTAQVIRFAKILSILADKLSKEEDKAEYKADIEKLTKALNDYSWDKDSGYYSYVLHDENYELKEKFVTESGENLNKGLDGIYPIIAGACNEEQKKAILSHLQNEKEMLSPYGISAVDQSAGYFKVNGYWNGNIWFPHQWFIWKSMLDCGESDFAFEIAKRALDVWKREVESTYYTFEMVSVVTGNGGWFHNFGGLSTPINLWTKAYFSPGTVNVGFDTYLDRVSKNDNNTEMKIELTYYGENEKCTVLAVMNDSKKYKAVLDGKEIKINERVSGLCEIECSFEKDSKHTLEILSL